jgi:hypothetical protein
MAEGSKLRKPECVYLLKGIADAAKLADEWQTTVKRF